MACKTKVRAEKLHSFRGFHEEREDPKTVLIDNDKVRTTHCSLEMQNKSKGNPTFKGVVSVRTGVGSAKNTPREDDMFLGR